MFKKGTLLIPSGPSHDPDRKHLHVICNEARPDGSHLLVSISSWRTRGDPTCRLQKHEHRFLDHDSFVEYRMSRIESGDTLRNGVSLKKFVPHDDMNGQTFLRIVNGICRSPITPPNIRAYWGCEPQ